MFAARIAALFFSLPAAVALSQSFNIAVGPVNQQPASTYAAAGQPGYWNALPAPNNSTTYYLRDTNATTTNVSVWQYGGTQLLNTDDPGTTGDDQTLMDNYLITYTTGLETCLFFYDLIPGDYEILLYAWMPMNPAVLSNSSSDEEPGNPHIATGGAWHGSHIEGITYARHFCHVSSSGLLRLHSGIAPGGNPANGAAFNGVQLRQLPPKVPGDMNCDGAVNGADVAAFLDAMLDPQAYYANHPDCRRDNADMNNNGQVSAADVAGFVTALLAA